jgi:hypothetical protein
METLVQIQHNNMPEISTGSRFLDGPIQPFTGIK